MYKLPLKAKNKNIRSIEIVEGKDDDFPRCCTIKMVPGPISRYSETLKGYLNDFTAKS
ncbi:hypothetical protein [Anoxybacter fermentans]|uniref:hypothetical protein n=1 Tax=Anoxybacter fermentans TaxID=1323375 RepID=UPI0013DFBA78|nr:hypothetical protein [Anoxybacter fermentans]